MINIIVVGSVCLICAGVVSYIWMYVLSKDIENKE